MLFKQLKAGEKFRLRDEGNGLHYFHLEKSADGRAKIRRVIKSAPKHLRKALMSEVGRIITILPNTQILK